jgi:hypothetical protein
MIQHVLFSILNVIILHATKINNAIQIIVTKMDTTISVLKILVAIIYFAIINLAVQILVVFQVYV